MPHSPSQSTGVFDGCRGRTTRQHPAPRIALRRPPAATRISSGGHLRARSHPPPQPRPAPACHNPTAIQHQSKPTHTTSAMHHGPSPAAVNHAVMWPPAPAIANHRGPQPPSPSSALPTMPPCHRITLTDAVQHRASLCYAPPPSPTPARTAILDQARVVGVPRCCADGTTPGGGHAIRVPSAPCRCRAAVPWSYRGTVVVPMCRCRTAVSWQCRCHTEVPVPYRCAAVAQW